MDVLTFKAAYNEHLNRLTTIRKDNDSSMFVNGDGELNLLTIPECFITISSYQRLAIATLYHNIKGINERTLAFSGSNIALGHDDLRKIYDLLYTQNYLIERAKFQILIAAPVTDNWIKDLLEMFNIEYDALRVPKEDLIDLDSIKRVFKNEVLHYWLNTLVEIYKAPKHPLAQLYKYRIDTLNCIVNNPIELSYTDSLINSMKKILMEEMSEYRIKSDMEQAFSLPVTTYDRNLITYYAYVAMYAIITNDLFTAFSPMATRIASRCGHSNNYVALEILRHCVGLHKGTIDYASVQQASQEMLYNSSYRAAHVDVIINDPVFQAEIDAAMADFKPLEGFKNEK